MRKPSGTRKKQVFDNKTIRNNIIISVEGTHEEETARQRILHLLFLDPLQEFSLSEIAEQGKVSKSTASRIIVGLSEEGLVKLKKHPLVWRIHANYDSPRYKQEKILYNLSIIYRSGIVAYLEELLKHPKSIILFGSYSKGEDRMGSDIDIAIEGENPKTMRVKELERLERQLGRKIVTHVFNRKSVDSNLFMNIANGIVLSGFLEVRK